jgi:hypothetical protein
MKRSRLVTSGRNLRGDLAQEKEAITAVVNKMTQCSHEKHQVVYRKSSVIRKAGVTSTMSVVHVLH